MVMFGSMWELDGLRLGSLAGGGPGAAEEGAARRWPTRAGGVSVPELPSSSPSTIRRASRWSGPEPRGVLEDCGIDFEVVFIDDGSCDASARIIRRFCHTDRRVRLIRLRTNAGETAATDAGFLSARPRRVVTMDADLQNDPQDIPMLLDHLERWDPVTDWRANRQNVDSLVRRLSSRLANRVRNALSDESIRDSGCTLCAFRRECLHGLSRAAPVHPNLLRMQGYRVVEVPVNHRPRRFGRSKCGIANRLVWDSSTCSLSSG
jgi:glycosyltransferase involved in cell wall biosynthesis